jgi:hypothetical protein
MSGSVSQACCCEDEDGCSSRKTCDPLDDFWEKNRAEYITVGRPRGPTVYPGVYWPAWHNGISKVAELDAVIDIKVTKRTVTQTQCGGTCTSVNPPANDACSSSSWLTAQRRCQQTGYTDNMRWRLARTLKISGVSNDQQAIYGRDTTAHCLKFPSISDESVPDPLLPPYAGRPYPQAPQGYYPCILQGSCAVACVDANSGFTAGPDPAWWPGENRKQLPRFVGYGQVTVSPVPASTYPQIAVCGDVAYVNRCSTSTSTTDEWACLDFPLIVIPGHSGTMCDGTPSIGCAVTSKELGANVVMWGFDIDAPTLVARLAAMNVADGVYMGSYLGAWLCLYTTAAGRRKLRVLFNIANRITAAGQTFKFRTNVMIKEARTSGNTSPNVSYYVDVDCEFTPRKWCLNTPDCDCVQSYAENASPALNYAFNCPLTIQCSTPGPVDWNIVVGLEHVQMPYYNGVNDHWLCPCGTSCGSSGPLCFTNYCFQWETLPSGGLGAPGTQNTMRFLGDEPIERGHPFWRRYRNRYNHVQTLNDWYDNGLYAPSGKCVFQVYGTRVVIGDVYAPMDSLPCPPGSCSGVGGPRAGLGPDPDWCSCSPPASPNDYCGCPTQSDGGGSETCIDCVPPGCWPVVPSYFTSCPVANPYPGSAKCGPVTSGDPNAVMPCYSMSLSFFCNAYQQCSFQAFSVCGELGFKSCRIAGAAYVVAFNDYLIVDWDPRYSCTPVGTYNAYAASQNDMCLGRNYWTQTTCKATVS